MQSEKNNSICVVGSGNSDLFLVVTHFPVEGETLEAKDVYSKNGGKGANQAVAASRLGAKTVFAGQFGADSQGCNLESEMSKAGVDMSGVRRLQGVQTGQAIITVNSQGQNSIIIVGGANTHYNSQELPNEFKVCISSCRMLLLQKEIPINISLLAALYAKQFGTLVMLDCGGRDEEIPKELLSIIDFLSPNDSELKRIIDITIDQQVNFTPQRIRQQLLQKYPNITLILKEGHTGSAILSLTQYSHVNSISIINPNILKTHQIIDTTGAGDCFTAAFCVRYNELFSEGETGVLNLDKLNECLLFANCAAFICITVKGAMPSMPSRKQVDTLLNDIQK